VLAYLRGLAAGNADVDRGAISLGLTGGFTITAQIVLEGVHVSYAAVMRVSGGCAWRERG